MDANSSVTQRFVTVVWKKSSNSLQAIDNRKDFIIGKEDNSGMKKFRLIKVKSSNVSSVGSDVVNNPSQMELNTKKSEIKIVKVETYVDDPKEETVNNAESLSLSDSSGPPRIDIVMAVPSDSLANPVGSCKTEPAESSSTNSELYHFLPPSSEFVLREQSSSTVTNLEEIHSLHEGNNLQEINGMEMMQNGYGPEFIGQETEVVAAESNAETLLLAMNSPLRNKKRLLPNAHGASLLTDLHAMIRSGESQITEHSNLSTTDASVFMKMLEGDGTLSPLTLVLDGINQSPAQWIKQEYKKAKDRAKKRTKRADPSFRDKEREEALVRMRARRQDPSYREQERERDRVRRRLARQKNSHQRDDERERDKLYRRSRRTKKQDQSSPQSATSQYEDSQDMTSQDTPTLELGGEVVMGSDTLSFHVGDGSVVEVYDELERSDNYDNLETKSEGSVDTLQCDEKIVEEIHVLEHSVEVVYNGLDETKHSVDGYG